MIFNATLTLPGIAGFVLTIGAAVDANVLINERIREELKRGRRVLDALEAQGLADNTLVIYLSDNGFIVETMKTLSLLPDDGRLLATPVAVVTGLTYNFLPFMVLPLYASLEKIDPRLIEAGGDLFAGPLTTFRTVTLPLSMPGVVAGTLLTFIPASGDFINAALLGTPRQYMIGNVIQSKFLNILDYPTAAALSFTLMLFILVGIFLYARLLGAQNLTEAAI